MKHVWQGRGKHEDVWGEVGRMHLAGQEEGEGEGGMGEGGFVGQRRREEGVGRRRETEGELDEGRGLDGQVLRDRALDRERVAGDTREMGTLRRN